MKDSWVLTASTTEWAAKAPGEFFDLFDSGFTALFDDVGRAVVAGQFLPLRVPGHGDNPLGAELLGCQDGHESDCPSPTTATVLPGPASAATAANHPVPRTSDAASRCGIISASGCPGVATKVPSASGIRANSD